MNTFIANLFIVPQLILTSILLWTLSFVGRFKIHNYPNKNKVENFECGFDNTSRGVDNFFYKNKVAFCFLILYEIEFLLLLPAAFNSVHIGTTSAATLLAVSAAVLYTCVWDSETDSITYDN